MDIYTRHRSSDDGLRIRVNPGSGCGHPFAIIEFDDRGDFEMHLDNLGDCDRIIRAAETAKRRLKAVIDGTPHEWVMAPGVGFTTHCGTCGLLRADQIHAEPEQVAA